VVNIDSPKKLMVIANIWIDKYQLLQD